MNTAEMLKIVSHANTGTLWAPLAFGAFLIGVGIFCVCIAMVEMLVVLNRVVPR